MFLESVLGKYIFITNHAAPWFLSMSYELMFPKDFDFDKLLPTDFTPRSIISSVTNVTSAQPPLPT